MFSHHPIVIPNNDHLLGILKGTGLVLGTGLFATDKSLH